MHKMMQAAIAQAHKAKQLGEIPVGAVVVRDGEIIGAGYNQKESLNDPTAHAEIIAIRNAARSLGTWRLNDCALYVTAEPCPMCMGAVIQAHISKLVYGVSELRYGGVESTCDLRHHPQLPKDMVIYPGICETECAQLLKDFFKEIR